MTRGVVVDAKLVDFETANHGTVYTEYHLLVEGQLPQKHGAIDVEKLLDEAGQNPPGALDSITVEQETPKLHKAGSPVPLESPVYYVTAEFRASGDEFHHLQHRSHTGVTRPDTATGTDEMRGTCDWCDSTFPFTSSNYIEADETRYCSIDCMNAALHDNQPTKPK